MAQFQVRDRVSQQTVTCYKLTYELYSGGRYTLYHTDAPANDDFPHGHRLDCEVETDLDFIGPLEPPPGFFGWRLDGDTIVDCTAKDDAHGKRSLQ